MKFSHQWKMERNGKYSSSFSSSLKHSQSHDYSNEERVRDGKKRKKTEGMEQK